MDLTRTVAPALVLLLTLTPAWGQPPQQVERIINEIFELAGTDKELSNRRAIHETDLEEQKKYYQLSPEEVALQQLWIDIVFSGSEFTRAYRHGFAENFDSRLAKEALQWLRSPLGQKFRQMDERSGRADYPEKLNTFLNSPEAKQISDARREMLRRSAEESQCVEHSLDAVSILEMSRLSVLNRLRPPNKQLSEEQIRESIHEMREQNRESLSNGCWWPLLYLYHEASDAELEEYFAFYRSEAGRWLRDAYRSAVIQAYLSAGKRLGEHGFTWPEDDDWIR